MLTGTQLVTLQRINEGTHLALPDHKDEVTTILKLISNCFPIAKV
jgi:hypothetical protein